MAMLDYDQQPARRYTVLLVEDEFFIRDSAAEELTRAGFIVVQAASADDALDYLNAGNNIDLLITDIQMPGRLDGLSFAQRLRSLQPSLPIVVASGNLNLESAAKRIGKFVGKPYDYKEIVRLVRSLLSVAL